MTFLSLQILVTELKRPIQRAAEINMIEEVLVMWYLLKTSLALKAIEMMKGRRIASDTKNRDFLLMRSRRNLLK